MTTKPNPEQGDGLREKIRDMSLVLSINMVQWLAATASSGNEDQNEEYQLELAETFSRKIMALFTAELAAAEERGRREMGEAVKINSITELKPVTWASDNPRARWEDIVSQTAFELIAQFNKRVDGKALENAEFVTKRGGKFLIEKINDLNEAVRELQTNYELLRLEVAQKRNHDPADLIKHAEAINLNDEKSYTVAELRDIVYKQGENMPGTFANRQRKT